MTGKLCDCADFLLATRSTYMKNAVATMRFQIQKIAMVGLTTSSHNILKTGLLLRDFQDAFKEGDGSRLERL